jgi:raffinose/stachyose/melibiose transport system permease protein
MWQMIGTSLKAYLLLLCVGVPLGLFFSYYMYKRMTGAKVFRVLLFLPSILSAVVVGRIFLQFFDSALPAMLKDLAKLFPSGMENWLLEKIPKEGFYSADRMGMIMFFNVFVGFGTSVLMYSNAMSAIPSEITEAGRIDGVQGIKEFWFISLPMVFSTLKTFLVAGIATIFTNQMNLFSFYSTLGSGPNMTTYGYYIYVKSASGLGSYNGYPMLSAMGLILTAVAVPLTLGIKALLDKYGPGED